MRHTIVVVLALCFASGCSFLFDPNTHVGASDAGADGMTDSSVDGPVDSSTDGGDTSVPDGGGESPRFCMAPDEGQRWPGSLTTMGEIQPILGLAITDGDPPLAHVAHAVGEAAVIRRIDLDALEGDDGMDFDLSQTIRETGALMPLTNSIALRRANPPERLAITLTGTALDDTSTTSGIFIGSLLGEDLAGLVLDSMATPPANGLEQAVVTGRSDQNGRHIFRERFPRVFPAWGSMPIGSSAASDFVPLTGPLVPRSDQPVWAVGSDGHLALLQSANAGEMILWTGVGDPRTVESVPHQRYGSDLAWSVGDRYVLSHVTPTSVVHRDLECEFDCAGSVCSLGDGCPEAGSVEIDRDGSGMAMIATDHVPGVGVVEVLLEERSSGVISVSLGFLDPDLDPVLDAADSEVFVELVTDTEGQPFALDVDTLMRGNRVTVLVAIGYLDTGGSGTNQVALLSWDGLLCAP